MSGLTEFLAKVQADVDVASGDWSPAADLASQIIAEEHAPAMLRMLQAVATSYDHAYDERDQNGHEFTYAEGYRHRTRQVRTAMEHAMRQG